MNNGATTKQTNTMNMTQETVGNGLISMNVQGALASLNLT